MKATPVRSEQRGRGRARIVVLVLSFYAASSLTSCLTKMVLNSFPRPVTVSLAQQLTSCIGGLARVGFAGSALREWRAALPVAATLATSVVLYRISLVHNSLSFAQAVKTLQPLFATLLSAIFLREPASLRRVGSLLLLLVGVTIATTTELSFSAIGFACTAASSFAQALQAVLSKSLLVHNRIGENDLFACTAVCTTLLLLPLWLVVDGPDVLASESPSLVGSGAMALLLLNAVSNFVAQSLSFAVLCAVVSPVSAAVVSTFKRVIVIGVAVVWFHTPMTLPHACGIGIAVLGVTLFQERHKTAECATPHVHYPLSLAANPRRGRTPRTQHSLESAV